MGRKKRTYPRWIKLAFGVGLLLFAVFSVWFGLYIRDNKMSNFRSDVVIFVSDTTTADQLLAKFRADTHCVNMHSLERAFRKEDLAHRIRVGRYEIKKGHSSIEVARMIKRGWQKPCRLVLSGLMRTKEDVAAKISAQMMVDSIEIYQALEDEAFLAQFGFRPDNVFSMILPDTYEMYWNATVYEIFRRFYVEYEAYWNEKRVAKAQKQGLTPLQVSVLASIVAGETYRKEEYPYVARVYLNRLKKRMKLQACPTICYLYDYRIRRVLKSHLKTESPYNTYLHAGLPPGPICVPPKACIEAVLNPADGNYLYFSANPAFDGTNRFTTSFAEHQKLAREYQKELTRRQREAREGSQAMK
jgi:UPF0755 protein